MRTRQGETICLGEWIRPASADFPPAGGVWGGMRAGFASIRKFKKFFGANVFYQINYSHSIVAGGLFVMS